ncbi:hypothetical protein [Mesorhizobium sp. Root157]|uniref:hypothetical protein n=1 Tax=Mesorhizobium sp. Root157 TaxID=1736477 RepID=UPI000A65EEE1|nr:hypothetical protein [Mesorhizobium sp. Root157]
MSALLSALVSDAGGYLLGFGAILIAFLATYLKGRLSGAKLERTKQKAKEADSYEKSLKELADAAIARNSVDGRMPDSDRYQRD